MKTIYDDYHINMLMESIQDPVNKKEYSRAEMFNEVSELIGIEPLAINSPRIGGGGTIMEQYLLYMILRLGERVVEIENKQRESEL